MRNKELVNLNFIELLNYGGMPVVKNEYKPSLQCKCFCVACEKERLVPDTNIVLEQMSHGADTSDFESILGELPKPHNNVSIVFLLESPGGYYENGKSLNCKGIVKQPPVNHYYWTPTVDVTKWPDNPFSLSNHYGPYFSYLLNLFHLKNAYFTNIVKCSLAVKNKNQFVPFTVVRSVADRDTRIRNKCFELFLSRELSIMSPQHIFCFGDKARKMANYLNIPGQLPSAEIHTLYHPSGRMSWKDIVNNNNSIMAKALKEKDA